MKFNKLITFGMLSFCSIFQVASMETNAFKPSKKQRKLAKQEEEDRIVAQYTKIIESAWKNFDRDARLKLPIDTYIKIQTQFSPPTKQLIAQAPKINLTEEDKKAFPHLGKEKEIKEELNKRLEEYQKIILKNQELKAAIKKQEDKISELRAEKKKINTARKRARQKEKRMQTKITVKQQPSFASISSNRSKSEQLTPQQLANKKRFVALRTLFKKYTVQKEADLKNKFNDICWEINENCFKDRINDSCTFEYYSDTNELEIFTDDYEFQTSGSNHDLEINVRVLQQ